MPIHILLKIDGEWVYGNTLSCKYPTSFELMINSLLRPDCLRLYNSKVNTDFRDDVWARVSEVFALVLDCDEVCKANEFWEYVCTISSFNKDTDTIEFYDRNEGLLKFHEILHNSIDLRDWFKKNNIE
jgi:hypothetical protein